MFPPWRNDKDSKTHNHHVNDSMASPDYHSGIISMVMDENGSFTYDPSILLPDHVPSPKTTKIVRCTMTRQDSPAKVFAKMKSQIQREHHPLTEVGSNHPAFGSNNVFPKPHLSCEKRVSRDEVLDLKTDQELKNVGSVRRRLIKSQGCYSQMETPTSAVYKESEVPDNTIKEGFASVVGNSVSHNNLDMTASRADVAASQTAVTADPLLCYNLPQSRILNKCTSVHLERLPQMSPAKLFVHIKEKERKKHIQEGYKAGCGTITLHQRGHDSAGTTAFHKDETAPKSSMEQVRSVPGCADPIMESEMEGAADPGGDVQPLVMDPLLLASPRISFRKTRENMSKWPAKPAKNIPQKCKVTGVSLTRWMLKSNSAGLYVDGIRKDDKQPWHSSVIVERLSNTVLKTSSGKTYNLVGKMIMPLHSELPQRFLKKFTDGFPEDWRILYDKFMSEPIRETSCKVRRVKSMSDAAVTNQFVKPQSTPNVRRTAVSCTPTSSAKTGINMSRSGRIIKPPLDYWRGGRLVVDKDMNVTIHDSYETTVSFPQVKAEPEVTVSCSNREAVSCAPTSSAKTGINRSRSGRIIKPPLDYWRAGRIVVDKDVNVTIHDSYETTVSFPQVEAEPEVTVSCSNREEKTGSERNSCEMAPLRKVKPPPRRSNGARAKQTREHIEPLNSDLSIPVQSSSRSTWAIAGITAVQPTLCTGSVPESETISNHHSRHSQKRRLPKKCNPPASSDPPTADQASDSGDDLCAKRNSRKKSTKVLRETPPADQASDSSDDLWAKGNSRKKGTKVLRETASKARKTASKARKTLSKAKVKEDDEDQWSEAELARLRKAVNLFPKHLGGFWENVAQIVGTRSAEACQREHLPQGIVTARTKRTKTSRKKEEHVKEPEPPKITAGVGTMKRKQQVRQLLKAMPKEDYDDGFTNASMFTNHFQFPATVSSEESDDEFMLPDLEPVTPGTADFPTAKTPQCHHINADMLGSVNINRDNDRCVFQLQKRLKKSRADVHLHRHAVKDLKPSEKRCLNGENDSFLVWETRPESASSLESGEEEDFYFEDS